MEPHVTATAGSTPRYPPEADFAAQSSDDVDELGRSRGSQMTSHTSIIGHGRRKRGGGRWEQHRAPVDAFSRSACQSELELEHLSTIGTSHVCGVQLFIRKFLDL